MKKKLLFVALLIVSGAVAAENPLLSAPASDSDKWAQKLEEFKRPVLPKRKGYPKPFHSPNSYEYAMDDVCSACHTFAAHRKDKKYAPFYNAHGTFMSCNTCHFVKEGVTYRWGEIENGRVVLKDEGDFYGLRYVRSGERVLLSGEESKAKILPLYNDIPVEIPLEGNKNLMNDAAAVARMHNALSEKPLKCDDCHKPNGKLDFRSLGFSEERVKDLEHNEILEGLKKYDTLHFPKFIW
jgi:cytochrome c553